MHRPPKKAKKGFKVHAEPYNELLEYVKRTRPIPTHGHTETNSGTMPPVQEGQALPQFAPILTEGASPRLGITPGYVYAPYSDPPASGKDLHLPSSLQWVFEPQISGTFLTADPSPELALTVGAPNYVYLKLTWTAHAYSIGQHTDNDTGPSYSFKAQHNLEADGETVQDASASDAGGNKPGIFVPIEQVMYTLSSATFIVQQDQQPPQETQAINYMPCGVFGLNGYGKLAEIESPQVDAVRWFLEGPIYVSRPNLIQTGITAVDRSTFPEPPPQSASYVYPGAQLDN